jgi:uncharacterized repeat protein (TIGR03803 family)
LKGQKFMTSTNLCRSSRAHAILALILGLLVILTANGWAANRFETLYTFTDGSDGGRPYVGMIFDQAGNLYGTTYQGGVNMAGVVFELTPNDHGGWNEKVLHPFDVEDGMFPQGVLVFDKSGNLFGTTLLGGVSGDGTVFKLVPNGDGTWTESIVHSFDGGDGFAPQAGVIFDEVGNLYGTTSGGGLHNRGNVFKLSPNRDGTWTETVLHSFDDNGTDGFQVQSAVTFDKHGNLYGTTVVGGNSDDCSSASCGTVFQLAPRKDGSWKETIIHSFDHNDVDGFYPTSTPVFDKDGNLLGTTSLGGAANRGTVFKLSQTGGGNWAETVLFSFGRHKSGAFPQAGVAIDQAGNLYGTTTQGGPSNKGVVFELVPNRSGAWSEKVLRSFLNRPGANPLGGLILNKQGKAFGTTAGDDRKTFGSAFEVTP